MLNYNHLYYFHVTAIEGTIAGAAQRLRVTQPTVSEQLRNLERTLGVVLFERQASGLRLTDAGRVTFEHTSQMFRAGERLMEALGHVDATLPHVLRVGISGAVGRATSTDFLLPLLAIDGCMPSIRAGESLELIRELRGNELDLVLLESEPPAAVRQGLELVQLDTVTLVAIASPDLNPAKDWQDVGLLQYRGGSAQRWDVDEYLSAHDLRPKVVGEADDTLFMLEAVQRGGYVAFVPRSVARDAIAARRVKQITQLVAPHAGVFALYEESETAELVRRAVEMLLAQVRALGALEST